MAEANPDADTSALTTASAVKLLLANDPPETDKVENREEPAAEEENAPEPQADEADEVEVEAEDADDEAEDIDDATDAEDEVAEEEVEAEAEAEPVEPTYRVRIGEEEVDVPLSELTSSYMRSADYTQKTQQLAEERKSVSAELASVQGDRKRYADQLVALGEALSQQEQTEEYWTHLYSDDPLEYTRQKDLARDRKDAVAQVDEEKERVQQEQFEQLQTAAQTRMVQEHDLLLQAIPEWKDEAVAAQEKSAVMLYAQALGYSVEETNQVTDHRAVVALRNGWKLGLSLKKSATKTVKPAPKMTKAGQPKSKKQTSKRRQQEALANIGQHSGRKAMDAAIEYLLTE